MASAFPPKVTRYDLETPGYGWTVKPGETTPLVLVEEGRAAVDQAKLNESPNVILLYRLQLLRSMSDSNFVLAVLTLAYTGVNIVMLIFNYQDRNDDDCGDPKDVFVARCGSPVSEFIFHFIEFTATFVFSVIQAVALLYTPRSLNNVYDSPTTLKVVLFFAIVSSNHGRPAVKCSCPHVMLSGVT